MLKCSTLAVQLHVRASRQEEATIGRREHRLKAAQELLIRVLSRSNATSIHDLGLPHVRPARYDSFSHPRASAYNGIFSDISAQPTYRPKSRLRKKLMLTCVSAIFSATIQNTYVGANSLDVFVQLQAAISEIDYNVASAFTIAQTHRT
jgi:hypothetical protein